MKNFRCLTDLNISENAKINNIFLSGAIKRRLYDLGFTKGALVKCLFKSPGDGMTAFLIRGTVIALRKEDSDNISIGGLIS